MLEVLPPVREYGGKLLALLQLLQSFFFTPLLSHEQATIEVLGQNEAVFHLALLFHLADDLGVKRFCQLRLAHRSIEQAE